MSDYIKRDEALSFPFANGHYDHKNANEHFIFGCESYKDWLEDLPIADVRENVHAHWIKYPSGELICSNCGHRRYKGNLNDDRQHWFALPKFCEECGSIMDGGDDE